MCPSVAKPGRSAPAAAPPAGQPAAPYELYRTRFPGHTFVLCRLASLILLARLDRRVIPKLLETPGLVVPLHEVGRGGADGLEVLKDSAVDRLLLERAIPPLRHPVRFRFLDKAEAGVAVKGGAKLDHRGGGKLDH